MWRLRPPPRFLLTTLIIIVVSRVGVWLFNSPYSLTVGAGDPVAAYVLPGREYRR